MEIDSVVEAKGITRITALDINNFEDGSLIIEPHEFVGKETDSKFLYLNFRRIAERLGMPFYAASFMCSDEENGLERIKRSLYLGKDFASDIIGPVVFSQPSHVAYNVGHSSNVFFVTGHMGMYKHQKDGRVLVGKVESERDGVLRPTCGAIYHVMNRFLGIEQPPEEMSDWDVDLIEKLERGLVPFKHEFLGVYHSGKDDVGRLSLGMQYLVRKNVDVQVERLLQLLAHQSTGNTNRVIPSQRLVVGDITINRYKYPDSTLLTHAYLIKGHEVQDLTKIPISNNGTGH